MADQSEHLIGQPEISELLMRALFLKGDLPQYVGSPYAPVIRVADLSAPEYMPLRRWRRFMMRGAIAASAGNFTGIYFGISASNPNGREVMAVVESLWIRPNFTTNAVRFAIEGDVFALAGVASTGAYAQDDRSATGPTAATAAYGVGSFTNAASPLSGAAPEIVTGTANTFITSVSPERPLILTNKAINNTPRSYLWVVPTAVNLGLDVTVFWRERPMLETEL